MLEAAGNFHNFRLAAGLAEGSYRGRNFLDSDVYKWLEAAAWELANGSDAELYHMASDAIGLVEAAQCADGYLNTYYQTAEQGRRWTDMDHGHELYCAGHLFQAAVALQRAIGDDRLMQVARRFADHIYSVFGPTGREETCGHPEIEMALVELYRSTDERRYLELTELFIERRGRKKMVGLGAYGPEYHQDHVPVREAQEATGHAVRQLYLTTGVTDLYLETGEDALIQAMERLWSDIVGRKLFVTGGVGSRLDGEAFGDPYELPSDQCYCETCAAIANAMWNWRMLLASGDGRFADLIEHTLYNSILCSPSLDGWHYFYMNPLMVRSAEYMRISTNPPPGETSSEPGRPKWHDVACCPPNVMRILASLAHYVATYEDHGLQIHQYLPSDISWERAKGQKVNLRLSTNMPWDGQTTIEIRESDRNPWSLRLRLPSWTHAATVALNGHVIEAPVIERGYIVLERTWEAGDRIQMDLQVAPMLIEANPRVDATRSSVAVQHGPIVYCLEDQDQKGASNLLDIQIDTRTPLQAEWQPDLLGGVMVIEAQGYLLDSAAWEGHLYKPLGQNARAIRQSIRLVAIPYYAWVNREVGAMRVWIPEA